MDLIGGGFISADVYAEGQGGDVNIDVTDKISVNEDSAILTNTYGAGGGSNISIQAESLDLRGGFISADVYAEGQGGDVNIDVTDKISIREDSAIFTNTYSSGHSGTILIKADDVLLSNGAYITSSTLDSGLGGAILLDVRNTIQITGDNSEQIQGLDTFLSGETIIAAYSSGQEGNAGDAGLIDIKAKTILVEDFAVITTSTFGPGTAGTIEIEASETIVLNSSGVASQPNLIYGLTSGSRSTEANAGAGGTILIGAGEINVINSQISTTTQWAGNAGNIIIGEAAQLSLDDNNQLTIDENIITTPNPSLPVSKLLLSDSTITSASQLLTPQAGRAGTIKIAVMDEVRLENKAILSTSAVNSSNEISQVTAKNGNILLQAPNLI